MSKQNCRTGYAAVYLREYWFQRLSCALQRNLAAFYKFNFALFCGEIRYDFERNRSLANWKYRPLKKNKNIYSGSSILDSVFSYILLYSSIFTAHSNRAKERLGL